MRQKRAKTYRKLMSLYSMSFGFRQPYQVLMDSLLCIEAIERKLDFVKQLSSVLQGEVKPMITQCCIHELYLQKSQQQAVDLAKTFERRKCNHREPIPGDQCISSVVGDSNKHRYVIAAQSQPLRSKLRAIPAVPIVHVNRSVMVLEPPSDATIAAKNEGEEKALHAPETLGATDASSEPPRKKRKGPKGPNPLSVKKKQRPEEDKKQRSSERGSRTGEKRKRGSDDEGGDDEGGHEPVGQFKKRKRKRKAKVPQVAHTAQS